MNNGTMTITSLLAKIDQINAWGRDYKQYEQDYYAELHAYKHREKVFLVYTIIACILPPVYKLVFHSTLLFITMIAMTVFLSIYAISILTPIIKSHSRLKNHSKSYENLLISLMGTSEFSLRVNEIVRMEYDTFTMTHNITEVYYEVLIDLGDGFKKVGNVKSLQSIQIDSHSATKSG